MKPARSRRILVLVLSFSFFLYFSVAAADTMASATGRSWSALGILEEYFQKAKEFFQGKGEGERDPGSKEPGIRIERTDSSGGGEEDLTTAFTRVAESTIPAVVHIQVTQRREVPNPFLQFEDNPALRQYFGLPEDMPEKFEQELTGIGTGMIVDSKGNILTNNHVVQGATEIKVLLSNGEEHSAEVVGTDPKTDLAVIRIPAEKSLPHVKFGDSDKVKVAEWVMAIGHPRGLDQTVTQGIISAKHRTGITDPSGFQDFLQTDASINPGNSGGPLLNLGGEVIGVNTVIASESGGSEGLGFAIPSNMAVHVAKALIDTGKVERGWLGVSVQEITPSLAKSRGLSQNRGALIAEVMKGGPAERAGIKKGDVVLAYRGEKIENAASLRNRVAASKIGEEVKVTVLRDKEEKDLKVETGSLDQLGQRMASLVKERLGVEVGPVTEKEMEKYGMENPAGVVIQSIDRNGPMAKAQFEEEDLIISINNQPVMSVDSFLSMVGTLPPGEKVIMAGVDHRTGKAGMVEVEIPQKD
ncbi:MAG: PDZ domain-containing protein [Desulfobacteraceae bacterium]|nr:MAG: PDZ domain-containing protein [Desulfobacteraceae bacterium]